eukprot:COSAG01_NODE_7286_length_3269_cov_0.980126_6_plen_112_part_00
MRTKTYADPAYDPASLSWYAPTTAVSPEIATEMPNLSAATASAAVSAVARSCACATSQLCPNTQGAQRRPAWWSCWRQRGSHARHDRHSSGGRCRALLGGCRAVRTGIGPL